MDTHANQPEISASGLVGGQSDAHSDARSGSQPEKGIALKVQHLHKSFKLPTEKASGIKQAVVNFAKGVKGYKEFKVLQDINFEVKEGDFFGVVGRNGSGKSTLLKLISQIYYPDRGSVQVNGKLVPFIELGVGFNPELTGRENIYMNGALLGFSNEEVDEMYDEIVDFAELHDFMEQKLKNYSSGMQVRLAFSIAIKAEADILVLDEVLAVGDEAFQRKCNEYFANLKKNKKTVILVTHDMSAVQNLCNRAVLIHDGHLIIDGSPIEVSKKYHELNFPEMLKTDDVDDEKILSELIDVEVDFQKTKEELAFEIEFTPKQDLDDAVITFVIQDNTGEFVYRWTSDEKIDNVIDFQNDRKKTLSIKVQNAFKDGSYLVQVGIKNRDRSKEYAIFDNIVKFNIIHDGSYPGDVYWKLNEEVKLG